MATQTQTRPPLTDTVQQLAATPTAALLALQIQTLAVAGSMGVDKDIVVADATAGTFIVTLPAQPYLGKPYAVKETSGANSITVDAAGAGTIDGAANLVIAAGKAATFMARAIDPVTGLVTWAVLSQTDGPRARACSRRTTSATSPAQRPRAPTSARTRRTSKSAGST